MGNSKGRLFLDNKEWAYHNKKPARGRRLTPKELEAAAASLGVPVSERRYQPESDWNKAKREVAYQEAKELEKSKGSPGPPKSVWLRGSTVKPHKG